MAKSAARIRTDDIGRELARLIRDGVQSPPLKAVQYGLLERVALAPKWDEILPAVFVDPQEATFAEDGGLDIGNLQSLVTETYRIVHFFEYGPAEDFYATARDHMQAILLPLSEDASLSVLGDRIRSDPTLPGRADQISWSAIEAVEWHPEEQALLIDVQQRVKVIAFRWQVRWYNRM
jgi:hypothetical protein